MQFFFRLQEMTIQLQCTVAVFLQRIVGTKMPVCLCFTLSFCDLLATKTGFHCGAQRGLNTGVYNQHVRHKRSCVVCLQQENNKIAMITLTGPREHREKWSPCKTHADGLLCHLYAETLISCGINGEASDRNERSGTETKPPLCSDSWETASKDNEGFHCRATYIVTLGSTEGHSEQILEVTPSPLWKSFLPKGCIFLSDDSNNSFPGTDLKSAASTKIWHLMTTTERFPLHPDQQQTHKKFQHSCRAKVLGKDHLRWRNDKVGAAVVKTWKHHFKLSANTVPKFSPAAAELAALQPFLCLLNWISCCSHLESG